MNSIDIGDVFLDTDNMISSDLRDLFQEISEYEDTYQTSLNNENLKFHDKTVESQGSKVTQYKSDSQENLEKET
jgi:hypothetical protein